MDYNTITTVVILIASIFIVYNTLFGSTKKSNPLQKKNNNSNGTSTGTGSGSAASGPILEGKFTPQTLYRFNGFDDPKIYIAVLGKVYDVTRARQFYGPSGPYSNFAGHDASRGLAKNSFEMEMITPFDQGIDPLEDLTKAEWDSLNGWKEHFDLKYTCIGDLVKADEI